MWSSSASRRSSSSRAASIWPASQPSRSSRARPRHNPSASPARCAARSGSPSVSSSSRATHQAFEPPGVDLVAGNNEPVAVGHRLDRFGAQRAPKAHDATGYHLLPGGGGLLAPQRIGQSLGADHLARMHRQRGQHHPISRCQPGRVAIDGQRAEHADARAPHGRSVRPAPGLVNGTVTELLPRVEASARRPRYRKLGLRFSRKAATASLCSGVAYACCSASISRR